MDRLGEDAIGKLYLYLDVRDRMRLASTSKTAHSAFETQWRKRTDEQLIEAMVGRGAFVSRIQQAYEIERMRYPHIRLVPIEDEDVAEEVPQDTFDIRFEMLRRGGILETPLLDDQSAIVMPGKNPEPHIWYMLNTTNNGPSSIAICDSRDAIENEFIADVFTDEGVDGGERVLVRNQIPDGVFFGKTIQELLDDARWLSLWHLRYDSGWMYVGQSMPNGAVNMLDEDMEYIGEMLSREPGMTDELLEHISEEIDTTMMEWIGGMEANPNTQELIDGEVTQRLIDVYYPKLHETVIAVLHATVIAAHIDASAFMYNAWSMTPPTVSDTALPHPLFVHV